MDKKSFIGWTDEGWIKRFRHYYKLPQISRSQGMIHVPFIFTTKSLFSEKNNEYPKKVRITIEEI